MEIYVDDFDERTEFDAAELVSVFHGPLSERSPEHHPLWLCFSCQPYPPLIGKHDFTIRVEDENANDISTYVRDRSKHLQGSNVKLNATELEDTIIERSNGVFQWVVLVVPKILDLRNRKDESFKAPERAVHNISAELRMLYQEAMETVDFDDLSQSLALVRWVCFSFRRLSLDEVRMAMNLSCTSSDEPLDVHMASDTWTEELNLTTLRIRYLLQGLVEVVESHTSTVVGSTLHERNCREVAECSRRIATIARGSRNAEAREEPPHCAHHKDKR